MRKITTYFLCTYILCLVAPRYNAQGFGLNYDFESSTPSTITLNNQLSGWNISHGVWGGGITTCNQINCCALPPNGSELIEAPNGFIDPIIGAIYPVYSVFGDSAGNPNGSLINTHLNMSLSGDKFLRLNNKVGGTAGNRIESLTRTLSVTATMNVLDVAYMILTNGAHNCCESPGFRMTISSSTCAIVFNSTCPNLGNSPTFYVPVTGQLSTNPNSIMFSKWRVKRFDLTDYIGQNVTLTINACGCLFDGHFGYAYVDTRFGTGMFTVYNMAIPGGTVNVPYCKRDSLVIYGPKFYNTYDWSGPQGFSSSSPNIVPTVSGVYTLNLDMAIPCDAGTKTISVNFLPEPFIYSSTSSICPGGTAILTASGSASYTWTHNGSTSPSVAVSAFQNTAYSVICLDTNGCLAPAFFTIAMLSEPTLTIHTNPKICVGDVMKISAFGANTYSWQSSNGYVGNLQQVLINSNSYPEVVTFSLAGTAANSCTSTASYSIKSYPLPLALINITPSQTVCVNSGLNMSGTGGVRYEWRGPANFFNTKQNAYFIPSSLIQAGEYTLCAIDTNGCRGYSTKTIALNDLPYGQLKGVLSGCAPFLAEFEFVQTGSRRTKLLSSEWKIENVVYSEKMFSHWIKSSGNFLVEGNMLDSNACANTYSFYVNSYPKPRADFQYAPQQPVENQDYIEFTDMSTGENLTKWNWFFYNNQNNSTNQNVSFLFENEGVYAVAHLVQNEWGCADSLVQEIKVFPDIAIFVPNAFTPNGDERNPSFKPVTRGILSYRLQVFSRWGQLIYDGNEKDPGWDGTFGEADCQEGVYVWKLSAKDARNNENEQKGFVDLIR
ncbi:gliding motility-associated C-terminal domain-containing protein [Aurantibacillus circumpalustris]|uniref:T9SS type B sorting domain-containing protein n=1 Tax=Aurantibacillus circumpalustris TaxID=3036359 RepID=UPI00295BA8B4|nr:gliding motility-associated C-terminal domain-containing protein [Aurantibacillus circumpalustris]